jgi:hypothetical protein
MHGLCQTAACRRHAAAEPRGTLRPGFGGRNPWLPTLHLALSDADLYIPGALRAAAKAPDSAARPLTSALGPVASLLPAGQLSSHPLASPRFRRGTSRRDGGASGVDARRSGGLILAENGASGTSQPPRHGSCFGVARAAEATGARQRPARLGSTRYPPRVAPSPGGIRQQHPGCSRAGQRPSGSTPHGTSTCSTSSSDLLCPCSS